MKKQIIAFLLILLTLLSCENTVEPTIVIVPDLNFLNALIDLGVDNNGDGAISSAEAAAITSLDVSNYSILNMTGIEAFVNLDTLDCSGNKLRSLDVSNNTDLKYLKCVDNLITSLSFPYNTELEYLNCCSNELTSLDVSKCTIINYLDAGCSNNQLRTLDLSNNILLEYVRVTWNRTLSSLDVSNCTQLKQLACDGTQLTSLDVSNSTLLETLKCDLTQLTSLDLSNNSQLTYLDIKDISTLYSVCVWELPFPPEGIEVNTTGSPNVYFTTDCN